MSAGGLCRRIIVPLARAAGAGLQTIPFSKASTGRIDVVLRDLCGDFRLVGIWCILDSADDLRLVILAFLDEFFHALRIHVFNV